MARSSRVAFLSALLCLSATAPGEEAADAADFALPAAEIGEQVDDGGVDLDDADFTGNPANGLFSWWPEDLVVAPIPGYSPQLGWSLTLVSAYFVTEREAEGPPPSMLGGFGFVSDNGSYMAGLGGRFHLRDDRVRLKAGVGYMDLRYRYYGSGLPENDLGVSLDILQEGPMYFASASARVWRRLYLGAGFLGGSIDQHGDPRGTGDIDKLGGEARLHRWVALAFFLGALFMAASIPLLLRTFRRNPPASGEAGGGTARRPYAEHADGFIVGTALKRGGKSTAPVDPARAKTLMNALSP